MDELPGESLVNPLPRELLHDYGCHAEMRWEQHPKVHFSVTPGKELEIELARVWQLGARALLT